MRKYDVLYRNPQTKEIFPNIKLVWKQFTGDGECEDMDCELCPLASQSTGTKECCWDYCKKYPIEAATLMGYEVEEIPFEIALEPKKNQGDYFRATSTKEKANILYSYIAALADSSETYREQRDWVIQELDSPLTLREKFSLHFVSNDENRWRKSYYSTGQGVCKTWEDVFKSFENETTAELIVLMAKKIGKTIKKASRNGGTSTIMRWLQLPASDEMREMFDRRSAELEKEKTADAKKTSKTEENAAATTVSTKTIAKKRTLDIPDLPRSEDLNRASEKEAVPIIG